MLANFEDQDFSEGQKIHDIAEKLSLKLEMKGKDYYKKNKKKNDKIKEIIDALAKNYKDLVQYLVFSESRLIETMTRHLTKDQRQKTWMGLLTGKLLSFCKVKTYVCRKLQ